MISRPLGATVFHLMQSYLLHAWKSLDSSVKNFWLNYQSSP